MRARRSNRATRLACAPTTGGVELGAAWRDASGPRDGAAIRVEHDLGHQQKMTSTNLVKDRVP